MPSDLIVAYLFGIITGILFIWIMDFIYRVLDSDEFWDEKIP